MSKRDNKTVTTGDKIKLLYGTPEEKKLTQEKILEIKRQDAERIREYNKKVYAKKEPPKQVKFNSDWLLDRFKEVAKTILPNDKEFVIDRENHDFIKTLVYYFSDNEKFLKSSLLTQKGDLNKGLLVMGTCGFGKTIVFKIFKEIFKGISYTRFPKGFAIKSCNDVVIEFNLKGAESYHKMLKKGNFMYDDFGTERDGKFFGNSENVMKVILEERYNPFIDEGRITHLTSNLNLEQLNERYGFRLASRIPEMFNTIVVNSDIDRRKN